MTAMRMKNSPPIAHFGVAQTLHLRRLFETIHLESSRSLGSSDKEIQGALQRMSHDRCAPMADQLAWLVQAGFSDVDCFYRSFRFAVFGGWKPTASHRQKK
jgi:tRNA (cmo5U34)-methyltransferase